MANIENKRQIMNQPYKKLWRSRKDRKIAGVCGGLGAYFGVDPVLIRIIFILFLLVGGTALLAYIILWIVTPLEPEPWQDK
jgi:phage shock protein C